MHIYVTIKIRRRDGGENDTEEVTTNEVLKTKFQGF